MPRGAQNDLGAASSGGNLTVSIRSLTIARSGLVDRKISLGGLLALGPPALVMGFGLILIAAAIFNGFRLGDIEVSSLPAAFRILSAFLGLAAVALSIWLYYKPPSQPASGSASASPPTSSIRPSSAPTSSRPATSTPTKASACSALRRTAATEARALGTLKASIDGNDERGTVTLPPSNKAAFQDAKQQVEAALQSAQAAYAAFQDLDGELPTTPKGIRDFPSDLDQIQMDLPGLYGALRPAADPHSGYDAWNQLTNWTTRAGYVAKMKCPRA